MQTDSTFSWSLDFDAKIDNISTSWLSIKPLPLSPMEKSAKSKQQILDKLGIEALNAMQLAAHSAIRGYPDVVLLSPTGSGKTLAFLLPIFAELSPEKEAVQTLILAPSRELCLQIEQVAREMGAGFKINAAYGGRSIAKDREELATPPALLIGTPGRIADHLRRGTFAIDQLKTLVLDEFDKSLEIGFEDDMSEIIARLPHINKRILTSATEGVEVPEFVGLRKVKRVDFLDNAPKGLQVKGIVSPEKDKLNTLVEALKHLGNQAGIIFCNFKDSIQRISDHLSKAGIPHGTFYGGLEQHERERALIKFRNGTHQLLLATDLAARGIDVPEIRFILHYQLPLKAEEFTHRNGRTARMHAEGTAFVLHWEKETLPDFIQLEEEEEIEPAPLPKASPWATLFVSGGRRDKISKGDLAGFFLKEGGLNPQQLGVIELKPDCAFVAVHGKIASAVVKKLNNKHLKKRKVRIYQV
jgi:superfamily II DNA/RNA helicase